MNTIHTSNTELFAKPSFLSRSVKKSLIALCMVSSLLLTACSDDKDKNATSTPATETKEVIKIGTSPGDFGDLVRSYLGPELEKAGYKVELSEITDIVIPNVSVEEGSLDINIFQHKPYMEEFNRVRNGHLAPLVQVPTAPYGIYGGKLKSVDEIKNGATVGIPSNVTNFSRGLWILEGLGWIELNPEITDKFHIGKNDIIANPYNIEIKEIEAPQMVRARPDLDYAIINGNFAQDAGIHFTEALSIEPSKYFVNWVVVNEKNLNTPWAHKVIEIVNSDGFIEFSSKRFAGYNLPLAWD